MMVIDFNSHDRNELCYANLFAHFSNELLFMETSLLILATNYSLHTCLLILATNFHLWNLLSIFLFSHFETMLRYKPVNSPTILVFDRSFYIFLRDYLVRGT